jgi:hypothetical protein
MYADADTDAMRKSRRIKSVLYEHVQHSTVQRSTVVAAIECGTPILYHMPSLAAHTLSLTLCSGTE